MSEGSGEGGARPRVIGPRVGGSDPTPSGRAARVAVVGSLAGKAVELASLVLLATVVPRVLGPGPFGRFSAALTVVTLGSLVLTLGGPTVMARYVPAADPERRIATARALGARLAIGRARQLAVIGAAAAALVVVGPSWASRPVVVVVAASLALNVAATLALQVALGLGRTGPWSSRWPLQNMVMIAVLLALHPALGERAGLAAIAVGAVAAAVLGAVAIWPVVRAEADPVAVPDGALRFGTLQAGGAALTQFAQRGAVLAVAVISGSDTETGYTALALGIALGATYAVLQSFTVALPHLAGADDVDTGRAEAAMRRLALVAASVSLPLALGGLFLVEPLVPVLFGEDFGPAASAFGPALALVVLAPLGALVVQVSALRLRAHAALASGVCAATAFVAVSVGVIPSWGAVGGTTAALAAGAAGPACAALVLRGAVGVPLAAVSFGGAAAVAATGALVLT